MSLSSLYPSEINARYCYGILLKIMFKVQSADNFIRFFNFVDHPGLDII